MKQVVLASNNQGKVREFTQIFAKLDIEVIPQAEFKVPEIDEPFATFVENALHKARHCSKYTKLPALADDSGLCVNALNGAPGVHSARYAGTPKSDSKNNQKLINDLSDISENKSAYYYCVLVLVQHENDPTPVISDGRLHGEIILEARGSGGFGYDPYFFIPKYNKTAAELLPQEKNQISHRSIAIKELLEKLRN